MNGTTVVKIVIHNLLTGEGLGISDCGCRISDVGCLIADCACLPASAGRDFGCGIEDLEFGIWNFEF